MFYHKYEIISIRNLIFIVNYTIIIQNLFQNEISLYIIPLSNFRMSTPSKMQYMDLYEHIFNFEYHLHYLLTFYISCVMTFSYGKKRYHKNVFLQTPKTLFFVIAKGNSANLKLHNGKFNISFLICLMCHPVSCTLNIRNVFRLCIFPIFTHS